jgi:hypothetical protein
MLWLEKITGITAKLIILFKVESCAISFHTNVGDEVCANASMATSSTDFFV